VRRYRYVGPPDVHAVGHDVVVASTREELDGWLRRHDAREPFTYVVDLDGRLRLAPRHSEHIACAGGGDVLAAGEMSFVVGPEGWRVVGISNQSTGFCPDLDSWDAVAAALDGLGVPRPDGLTEAIVFRRCDACDQRNVVREGDFICALCGAALPLAWNFG
jgi:hypothetical protein